MNLSTSVNQNYDKLNENDKIIIQQILNSQQLYCDYSCEQIAAACHISRATLLRLCRKIGLHSFSELKYLLKEEQAEQPHNKDDFHSICMDYQLLLEDLEKIAFQPICEMMYEAETIYIFGTGNEQKSIAQELKRIFLMVGKCVIDLFDAGEIAFMKPSFQESDVFIIISLSGETKEGIDILRDIRGFIQTISLTRLNRNSISSLCEQKLYVATRKLDQLQIASYEVVGAFYALLDYVFMNYIAYQKRIKDPSL